jgi:hypothetical protein
MDSSIKNIAFTLVLNGMPFIKQQMEIIPKIFDHWYIIEGVALPTNCTSWCKLPDRKWYNSNFCSVDGTYEFLNSIKLPNVSVIRKNSPWNGKIEMCNSFMHLISNSILMEFDVDEIWDKNILLEILKISEKNFNRFDSMKFKCNYFVGDDILLQSNEGYGDRPSEWIRLWTVQNCTQFNSHEPPVLNKKQNRIIEKKETSNRNWIFDHYAYTTEPQVSFKEDYYGYKNALAQWKDLQSTTNFPIEVNKFLPWIENEVFAYKIKS